MKRKKKAPFLWVHMTDEEIFAYSPVYYVDIRDALDALHGDIRDIAKKNHYKTDAVMVLSVNLLEDQVKKMWEGWTYAEQETES